MKKLTKAISIIICLYVCLSLLCLDGALVGAKNHILRLWTAADFILPLIVVFVFGLIQRALLNSNFQYVPLVVSFVGVVLSDVSWLCSNDYGGRIIAFLLLSAAGPICVGSVMSTIIFWLIGKGKPASNVK